MPTVAASSSSAAAASSSSSTAVNVHLHRHGGRASSSGSASAKLPHGHSAAAAAAVVDPRVEILQSENRRLRVHLTQELEAARLARVKYERMARNLVRREKEMTQQAIASDVDAGAGSGFSALRTRKRATIVTRLQAENERLAADLRQCRKDLADLRLERKSSSVVEMKLMLFEYFSEIQRLQVSDRWRGVVMCCDLVQFTDRSRRALSDFETSPIASPRCSLFCCVLPAFRGDFRRLVNLPQP